MSYCRFSDGDVYLYPTTGGLIQCCSCRLTPKDKGWHDNVNFYSPEDALKHLVDHKNAGHDVPDDAIDRLKEECE